MGCFWGAEKAFWSLPGVWVTAVGYQGGGTPNPTYREACSGRTGHAEAVRVVFEPGVVSYEQLLGCSGGCTTRRRASARATTSAPSTAPRSSAHGPEQLATAVASRDAFQTELSKAGFGDVTTEIREAPAFYFAEPDHQQYLAKVPNGYCPNHRTGVALPADFKATPLQYVD